MVKSPIPSFRAYYVTAASWEARTTPSPSTMRARCSRCADRMVVDEVLTPPLVTDPSTSLKRTKTRAHCYCSNSPSNRLRSANRSPVSMRGSRVRRLSPYCTSSRLRDHLH